MMSLASGDFTTILPPGVLCVTATPAHAAAPLHAAEEEWIAALPAHSPRRGEFRSGRACAREALARFGCGAGPLLPAPTREPLWPGGIVGSITHAPSRCAVAVARRARWIGIGIDVEAVARVGDPIAAAVCTARELAGLHRCGVRARRRLTALLFSAKESVFKALFPATRVFLDFADVELDIDAAGGRFSAHPAGAACAGELGRIDGRFAFGGGFVHSAALLAA